jgi:orotidine-5'-phosphate decarboxylase
VSSRVIVALDLATAEEAVRTAQSLANEAAGFKVGLRLLHGPGPGTVAALAELGKPVFADAKLHDIPSQVEAAARRLGDLGTRWLTVHAAGGPAMIEAAIRGLAAAGHGGGVLAVTVLTSLDKTDIERIAPGLSPGKLTSRLARLAAETGCEGLVCAAPELGVVNQVAAGLLKFVPGVGTGEAGNTDQARVATPAGAAAGGADYLVIGRSIVATPDPLAALITINGQVESALVK